MKVKLAELDAAKNNVDTGENNVDTGALARVTRAQLAVSAPSVKACDREQGRTAESSHLFIAHLAGNALCNLLIARYHEVNKLSPEFTLTITLQTTDSAELTHNPFIINIKLSVTTRNSLIPLPRPSK